MKNIVKYTVTPGNPLYLGMSHMYPKSKLYTLKTMFMARSIVRTSSKDTRYINSIEVILIEARI